MIAEYNRSEYPYPRDLEGVGFDSRETCLRMQSVIEVTHDPNGDIVAGLWFCRYTGRQIRNVGLIDVDHIIALSEAHRLGAHAWSREHRRNFANDQENLLAVSKGSNLSKGGRGEFNWMPLNVAFWNTYLIMRQRVRDKYKLQYGYGEKDAIRYFENLTAKHPHGVKLGRVRAFFAARFSWMYSPL